MTMTGPIRRAAFGVLLLILTPLAGFDALHAQAPPPQAAPPYARVPLTAGRSTVLATDFDITRIAVTNPAIADAVVVQPREILVDGKAPGTISLIVWGPANQRVQYDVVVEQPVAALQQQLGLLFPGEEIQVALNADAIVLSGRVSATEIMLRAGEIAKATAPKGNVINLLQVPGATDARQVMLQVRFAEVNRRAITELGANIFTGPAPGFRDWVGRGTTQQFPAPEFKEDELVFSDFLNLFLFNTNYNVGAVLRLLKQTGYFQSLAEPNLIAYNGQEASFLAGGEFPIPFSTGIGAVSVVFKEFGVRLNFTPTIAGDLIRLHVRPEVSSLDFNNGILLEGFRIPALTVRRAETDVELRDGQSFAIAGLIDNEAQLDEAAVPVLSRLPIIGPLFKSKADRQEKTELLVLITPRLVRPLDPDEVPALPTLPGRFLPSGDDIGEQLEGGGGTVDPPAPVRRVTR
jgi:pilus assembly protein CpaC